MLSAIVVGLILMVWSANRFLNGAANAAKILGMSPFLIGLTVVSLGTSGPELVVAAIAAINGTPKLAIGNAIGSNIANIGLVLGVTAIFKVLPFPKSVLKSELPWLVILTLITFGLLLDLHLSMLDGVFLLAGLAFVLWRIAHQQKHAAEPIQSDPPAEISELSQRKTIWHFLSGLTVLLLSAQMLVWAATHLATHLGISELVIGLTVVAIGTSLPELATTLGSALKKQPELAIGNIVGSNILNLVAVLALPALIAPTDIPPSALWRDFLVMTALTFLLALFAYGFSPRPAITRFEGLALVVVWSAYNVLLYHQV